MDDGTASGFERDAIVVLGCRVDALDGLPRAALRRVSEASAAFAEQAAPIVIASGGRRWGDQIEAQAMARRLEELGVPRSAVYAELCSLTTTENAAYSLALARRIVGREPRLLVVTCSWHLDRALACFLRAGAEVTGRGVDPPAPSIAQKWSRRIHETVSSELDRLAHARGGVGLERYCVRHLGSGEGR